MKVAPEVVVATNQEVSTQVEKETRIGTWGSFAKPTCDRSWCKILLGAPLAIVTALRVYMIMAVIFTDGSEFWGSSPVAVQVTDALLRPLIGALSFVPFFFRCRKTDLHMSSLAGCILVFVIVCAVETVLFLKPGNFDSTRFRVFCVFCLGCGGGLELVTWIKLTALRWARTGLCCLLAWGVFFALRPIIETEIGWTPFSFGLWWAGFALITVTKVSVLFWEAHRKQKLLSLKKMKDAEMARNAGRAVQFLRLGGGLTILGIAFLCFVDFFGQQIGMGFAYILTIDNAFVLLSVLVLGGLIGPETLDEEEVLKELAYMARSQGKRVAFPGKVKESSKHCIVSFPGKYAEEWDSAVRMAEIRSGACSLACVFLTDRDSGLGVHEENPEEPGQCWCKALYGQVPAAAYISIVEDAQTLSPEDLQFKETDAMAMGQVFLKREGQTDDQWAADKHLAETAAKNKCEENCGRAPWGCRWFHDWKQNVDQAAALGQMLHVFYFEGRVGCGKLPWEELSNETSVKEARNHSGLGASQTAEVAYLNKQGYGFEEHDVEIFYRFMQSHSA